MVCAMRNSHRQNLLPDTLPCPRELNMVRLRNKSPSFKLPFLATRGEKINKPSSLRIYATKLR
ncbi:unnamed protein product [Periconia digitata]|uniref:Uncharacterized protein n=1 Tax=Periconia digitata TaxID=1303443 RepID=A0A9W4UD02_9PLEO|nr:unnamed protein product [Periconia digitata]